MDKEIAKECKAITQIIKTLDRKDISLLKNNAEVLRARHELDSDTTEQKGNE